MAAHEMEEAGMMIRVSMRVLAFSVLATALWAADALSAAKDGGNAPPPATPAQPKAATPDEEKLPDVPALEPSSDRAKTKKAPPKRDKVAAAFTLPHDTVLDDKQEAAMKALKKRLEPSLRAAVEKTEKAEGAEKTAAALDVRKINKEIRAEIDKILDMPAEEAAKKQAAAAKSNNGIRHRTAYPNRYY